MTKFQVNDRVKAKSSSPNGNHRIAIHDEGIVRSVETQGRYEYYTVEFENVSGWTSYSDRTGSNASYTLTGGNLVLVTPGVPPVPPPPPPTFEHQETVDLALTVISIMREAAKKHNWCSESERLLKKAGLEAYMDVAKTVTLTIEVPVAVAPGTKATDEDFIALAKQKAGLDESLALTSRVR